MPVSLCVCICVFARVRVCVCAFVCEVCFERSKTALSRSSTFSRHTYIQIHENSAPGSCAAAAAAREARVVFVYAGALTLAKWMRAADGTRRRALPLFFFCLSAGSEMKAVPMPDICCVGRVSD